MATHEDRDAADGDRRIRIAHVIYRLQAGGMENGVVNLINELPNDRFEHEIVCVTESTGFAKRLRNPRVAIHELNKRPGKDPAVYRRFWRTIREMRPDVVHTRNLGTLDLAAVARAAGVPVRIHGEHGWDAGDPSGAKRRYRWLRRIVDPAVTRYVTVSGDIRTWLCDRIGIAGDKVVRICNGVDTTRFRPDGPAASWPFSTDADRSIVVGTVGRLDPIKRVDLLLESVFRILRGDPRIRNRLRVVVVGDGPLGIELEESIGRLDMNDMVLLAGRRDDLPEVFRSLDLFVLASDNEGISNTILEAMASGVPVVATDVGGNSELVEDGVTGRLVRAGDAGHLAAAIGAYLADGRLREQHGAAARRRAEARFGLQGMVARYGSLYRELTSTI